MKILVVDDDRISAAFLCAALENLGHEPTEEANGCDALRAISLEDYRLVISDWMMLGMDGLQLCRAIRGRKDAPGYIYFMVLSGKDSPSDREIAFSAGVDDFLAKPLDYAQLTARLAVAEQILGMEAGKG